MYAYIFMRVRVGGGGAGVWKGGDVTMRVSASFRRCRSPFEPLSLSLSLPLFFFGVRTCSRWDDSSVCVCVCVCVCACVGVCVYLSANTLPPPRLPWTYDQSHLITHLERRGGGGRGGGEGKTYDPLAVRGHPLCDPRHPSPSPCVPTHIYTYIYSRLSRLSRLIALVGFVSRLSGVSSWVAWVAWVHLWGSWVSWVR